MIAKLLSYFAAAALRRWILGAVIGIVVISTGTWWYGLKSNLRDEGRMECIQAINEQTVIDLQEALAGERVIAEKLRAVALVNAAVNTKARLRLAESESVVAALKKEMAEQEETDETYKEWRNSDLPLGVGERLRSVGAGSN